MKLNHIRVDAKAAEAGQWIGHIPDMSDLELEVRGIYSASARNLRNKLFRALPAHVRNAPDGIPADVADAIEAQVLHQAVLLNWRNLSGDDGKPLPYDRDLALQLLTNPDFIFFREAVSWAASRAGRFLAQAEAADLGNLLLTPNGTSDGLSTSAGSTQ